MLKKLWTAVRLSSSRILTAHGQGFGGFRPETVSETGGQRVVMPSETFGVQMKRVLLTGGAGFIGHHVAEHLFKNTDWNIVFLDRLDCSGNLNRLTHIEEWAKHRNRCKFIYHDLRSEINLQLVQQIGPIDILLHLAASTHVDRSIVDPVLFVMDNVVGTTNLLEYARKICAEKVIYFSTDEVFGPAPVGIAYGEWDRYKSSNPYAASKAGGEEMAVAFQNTYAVPVIITHTMNVFGERQHPEKFIPSTIEKVRTGQKVTIHADKSRTKAGSRMYLHARNLSAALLFVLEKGTIGEKYNIVGEREVDNLTLAQMIADIQGKKLDYELTDFHSSRPGHDLRYALSGERLKKMGFKFPKTFEQSLEKTVHWTLANREWA